MNYPDERFPRREIPPPEYHLNTLRKSLCIFTSSVVKKYAEYTGYEMDDFDPDIDYYDCLSELCEISLRVKEKESIYGHRTRQRWRVLDPFEMEMIVDPYDRDGTRHVKPVCIDIHFNDWKN